MKILTLNTWQERGPWKDRWEVIFEGLRQYQPDIIGIQEVFNREWAARVQIRTGYPTLVFPPEHSGLMLLAKFPAVESSCLTMKTKSPTEDYLRYALYAKLKIKDKTLAIFNTHLSWQLDEGALRQKQVDELIEFTDEKAAASEGVALGDFNALPETAEIKKMNVLGKWVDTFAALHPCCARSATRRGRSNSHDDLHPARSCAHWTWDNRNPYAASSFHKMPDRRIDYIFMRNQRHFLGRLTDVKLVYTEPDAEGVYATDHFGVLATFL